MAAHLLSRLSSEQKSTLLLVGACLPLIVLGVAARPSATVEPVSIGTITNAAMVEIRDEQNVAVLSGEFRRRNDSLGNSEFEAALMDSKGRKVIGEVEIEIPARGRENRRPELEVDILGLPPNQAFSVVVDDRVVGKFVTDDRGSVDMELQEGEVPFAGVR